jgi:CheY-like chemotaxis protein
MPASLAHKPQILLAEDDFAVRSYLTRVLEFEGYAVVEAENGREAVSQFIGAAPDLILLDLNMPEKDGWAAFELIQRIHPFVPIIVITARPHQYERARAVGVDALMEKPLDFPLLMKTIAELLAESDAEHLNRVTARGFKTALLKPSAS